MPHIRIPRRSKRQPFLPSFMAFVMAFSMIPTQGFSEIAMANQGDDETAQTPLDTSGLDNDVTVAPIQSGPDGDNAGAGDMSEPAEGEPAKVLMRLDKNAHEGLADNVQGEAADITIILDGLPYSLPSRPYTLDGYDFLGWSTTRDGLDIADNLFVCTNRFNLFLDLGLVAVVVEIDSVDVGDPIPD